MGGWEKIISFMTKSIGIGSAKVSVGAIAASAAITASVATASGIGIRELNTMANDTFETAVVLETAGNTTADTVADTKLNEGTDVENNVGVDSDVNVAETANSNVEANTEANNDTGAKTLNHDQIMSLIDASKGTSLHMMILFNVVMGLRCSEIIGVKYSDVDFIKRELTVSRQLGVDLSKDRTQLPAKTYTKQEIEPKTKSSYRTIKIPDIVFEAILEEKKLYNARKNRRKREFQDLGYICCSTYGRPRCKNYHYQAFKRLLKELGLPDMRWHDLRSTAITQILVSGINPKAAAKFAGHSKEIVTVDVYTDNRKLSVMKLDRLEEFIASVIPKEECQKMNLSEYRINVEDYLPS